MLLEVQDVSKKYKQSETEFLAVNHISFSISPGEFVVVCGPSGSGKSTLFHLIAGLLKPDTGQILFENQDIANKNNQELSNYRNQDIGYVLQGQSMLNSFSVIENICLPYFLSHDIKKGRKIQEKALKLLKRAGLEQYANEHPNKLSGGEMRRVAVLRALINEPKLIIADEPTSNLDEENALAIIKLLKEATKEGIGVIISTHDKVHEGYSDKKIELNHSKLVSVCLL